MAVSRVVRILQDGAPESRVTARGWVRTRRDSRNGFSFIELNDGSCLKNLQVVVDAGIDGYEESIRQVTTGASVSVDGVLKDSPGKGQRVELHAESLRVIGTADPATYPLQKKGHTMEFLREIAHLRPRTNTFGAVARVRNQICWSIHSFFQERGFLYLNSPVITTSDCEGAGEMFRVTTLDLEQLPRQDGQIDFMGDEFALGEGRQQVVLSMNKPARWTGFTDSTGDLIVTVDHGLVEAGGVVDLAISASSAKEQENLDRVILQLGQLIDARRFGEASVALASARDQLGWREDLESRMAVFSEKISQEVDAIQSQLA
ncbi:MAG: OB-fold nucleic acid binding domain-containing protein, partial [Planctomycetaceae bacterium]